MTDAAPGLRYERRWFTPDLCRAAPTTLWAFGDNLARSGRGPNAGQAVIRDEPNAVGIPTKRRPSMEADAFLVDADLPAFKAAAAPAFARLAAHLAAGGTVAWPADGIGTGRARLAVSAPRIWASLERARERLEAIRAPVPPARPTPLSERGVAEAPLVRAVLIAFPGAAIVAVRGPAPDAIDAEPVLAKAA